MTTLPRNTILHGDALTVLQSLPDNTVHCCITSPPYYGLRNYDAEGQIGAEASPQEYIAALVAVFREVRRVLRKDGTFWLVIGDSYAGNGKGPTGYNGSGNQALRQDFHSPKVVLPSGLKGKDLMMVPARVAIALQDDGWYLRSDIIWEKPNCMPQSVLDRPTSSYEHIFLFAKSKQYYYDADAIREPFTAPPPKSHSEEKLVCTSDMIRYEAEKRGIPLDDDNPGTGSRGRSSAGLYMPHSSNPLGRNKRDVWRVNTKSVKEVKTHFATFPTALIEPCILAGTSPHVCEQCGTPWKRVIERTGHVNQREPAHVPRNSATKTDSTGWAPLTRATDTFRPTCSCSQTVGSGKGIVLDPFCGAGTVPLVARQHGREYLGIELNPSYITLAEKRLGSTSIEEAQEEMQEPTLLAVEEAPLRKKLTITLLPKVVQQSQQPA